MTNTRTFHCEDTGETVIGYHNYLKTRHWEIIKERYKKSKLQKTCNVCKAKENLHLHHRTYKRVGREWLNDLIYLCEGCHKKTHEIVNKSKSKGNAGNLRDAHKKDKIKHKKMREQEVRARQQEKNRRKKREAKKCIGCVSNQEGFCVKFNRFASAARVDCVEQQQPVKTMTEVYSAIDKAIVKKKENIRKEIDKRR